MLKSIPLYRTTFYLLLSTYSFLLCTSSTNAQDLAFGRSMVDTLASPAFHGRGYLNDGMKLAADYLGGKFSEYGLKPLKGKSFFQDYTYSVNTFPVTPELHVDGKLLVPGRDFIVSPESRSVKGSGVLTKLDSVQFVNKEHQFILTLADKLTWSVEQQQADYSGVMVSRKAIEKDPFLFDINIEAKVISKFKARNICAFVEGTQHPDSFLVISAHYDHLGEMGNVLFPGANDNASGVSLLMNLAHYYATHPQKYSIAFILFSGEEAGLLGSKYFTEHPLIDLKKIRFLINTDLAGTGVEGITVVNASEFPAEFALMQKINTDNNLLAAVNSRGKAANSDHYFFTEKGVPSFFFYTLGGIKAYHDIDDKASTLPLNEHEDLFKLVTLFFAALSSN